MTTLNTRTIKYSHEEMFSTPTGAVLVAINGDGTHSKDSLYSIVLKKEPYIAAHIRRVGSMGFLKVGTAHPLKVGALSLIFLVVKDSEDNPDEVRGYVDSIEAALHFADEEGTYAVSALKSNLVPEVDEDADEDIVALALYEGCSHLKNCILELWV